MDEPEVTIEIPARAPMTRKRWRALRERLRAEQLNRDWRDWREVPRVDPAAGPEPFALDPTLGQIQQLARWEGYLDVRHDVGGMLLMEHPPIP
jgi:hypothetical protein